VGVKGGSSVVVSVVVTVGVDKTAEGTHEAEMITTSKIVMDILVFIYTLT
jgi:hypothetical protein